jgi:hypothetical protein
MKLRDNWRLFEAAPSVGLALDTAVVAPRILAYKRLQAPPRLLLRRFGVAFSSALFQLVLPVFADWKPLSFF